MFKVTKGIVLDIFTNIFNTRSNMNYNLRYFSDFKIPSVNSVYNGMETFSGPKSMGHNTLRNKRKGITRGIEIRYVKMETRKLSI